MRRAFQTAVSLAATFVISAVSFGQAPATQPDALQPAGLSEIVRLWPGEMPATYPSDAGERIGGRRGGPNPAIFLTKITQGSLSVFLPRNAGGPTPAIVICPGGGYTGEAITHEGFAVAEQFAARGIAAFVLKYRLPTGQAPAAGELPLPQQDVLRAIQFVRANAGKWNVDVKRVGVMGFSAGGHLAATAATLYDDAPSFAAKANHDDASRQSARPDVAILGYPVITMAKGATHGGSRKNLLGETPDAATEARFSTETRVTANTPPVFILHAKDDKTVPIKNAELFDAAAEKAGIKHEFVVFEKGGHGFGLGNNDETKTWFPKCVDWLKTVGFLTPAAR